MGIESLDENKPLELTSEELEKYNSLPTDDPDLISWMHEKGIEFNNGDMDVKIDGEMRKMNTSESDFGTLVSE